MARKYQQKSIMAKALHPLDPFASNPAKAGKLPRANKAASVMPLDTPSREKDGIRMARTILKPKKNERYPTMGINDSRKINAAQVRKDLSKKV